MRDSGELELTELTLTSLTSAGPGGPNVVRLQLDDFSYLAAGVFLRFKLGVLQQIWLGTLGIARCCEASLAAKQVQTALRW